MKMTTKASKSSISVNHASKKPGLVPGFLLPVQGGSHGIDKEITGGEFSLLR
jgi:hypothetical protein